jgi:UDP-N-acetyl-D-mannosaminuronate dehydrogenase
VRADPGAGIRPEVQYRFLLRLQPGADQPRRQGAPRHHHPQGDQRQHCRRRDFVDALYASIITAGTHKASSIKVAEAAKVIENTQRDLNIALVNDLAMLFNKLGIDTLEVLEARAPSGTSCRSAPAWSAATASAWTRTTSPTRRRKWATTRM